MTWGPFDLGGRAAVVTGAAAGIGFGCCARLREAGADVLIADRREAAALDAKARLEQLPGRGRVQAIAVDVAEPEQLEEMVQECIVQFGRLDVLVNNAGVFPARPLVDTDVDFIRRVMRVNVEGLIMATALAAKRMIELGHGGVIINLASRDAFQPFAPGSAVYGASKGAVVSFTKHAALELAPHGIRVVAVAPGTVNTEGTNRGLSGLGAEQMAATEAAILARQPLGRVGTPDDIATVVAFLASGAAGFITGDTVLADGGMLLL